MDNWAYHWWINDMYLANPLPLTFHSNPGMVFPPRKFRSAHDQALFAAKMLTAIIDHKEILDKKALPVEKATSREKGQPLCMAQYYRLLSSYRAPGNPRDSLLSIPASPALHVVVACRNQMYVLPVRTEDRTRLTDRELCCQLLHILQEAPKLPPTPHIGLLTTERRHVWAAAREHLLKEERNRTSLNTLESSLVVVCFDEALPPSFNSRALRGDQSQRAKGHEAGNRDETNMAHQMINGGGSGANSANRWFDKTIQLVISSDGVCGLCYEHSPSEGVAVVKLMEHALKGCEDLPPAPSVPPCMPHLAPPRLLQWDFDDETLKSIEKAAHNVDSIVEDMDFYVYRFTSYGKDYIKSCKVSPDVYIQLALQLAYFRLYHHLVATYESGSTRRFLLGRVDCIRSATVEAQQWVTAMCQGEEDLLQAAGKRVTFSLYDEKKKIELFDIAAKKQTDVMVENILGQGIDIHLLGLRELAKELGEPVPDIFADEAYKILNRFGLSTSQVLTISDSFMGYGPVIPDGYGASYNPHNDSIIFCLSAFHSCESTSTWKFAHSLEESLILMKQLLDTRQ